MHLSDVVQSLEQLLEQAPKVEALVARVEKALGTLEPVITDLDKLLHLAEPDTPTPKTEQTAVEPAATEPAASEPAPSEPAASETAKPDDTAAAEQAATAGGSSAPWQQSGG